MAQLTRSTKIGGGVTLQANTTARAADVETDMALLFSTLNGYDAGTTKWAVVSAQNSSATPLIADNSTGTNNIAEFKDNGTSVVTIANGGTMTMNGGTIAMGSAKITGLAAGTANGDALRWEQLFGTSGVALEGNLSFTDTTEGIVGTATNDSADAGNVGQYIDSAAGATSIATTATWQDLTSISLTAGDWDVSGSWLFQVSSAALTNVEGGVSATAGNSATGLALGTNHARLRWTTSNEVTDASLGIHFRVSLASTTTYYLKVLATFGSGNPEGRGRIMARRVR